MIAVIIMKWNCLHFQNPMGSPSTTRRTVPRPANVTATTYDGKFRVPATCRIVCAMAVCPEYELNSEILRIQIPQRGQENRPAIDPTIPHAGTSRPGWTIHGRYGTSSSDWKSRQVFAFTISVSPPRAQMVIRTWSIPAPLKVDTMGPP